jgi:hypothetical protein
VYIGKTKLELDKRKRCGYGKNVPFYQECEIELIEVTDDVSRERYWIEYYLSIDAPLLNILKGNGLDRYLENQKWRKENKEKVLEYYRSYYQKNKDKYKNKSIDKEKDREYRKKYYEENKENILKRQLEYQEENKEKLKEYRRNYYREYRKRKKVIIQT